MTHANALRTGRPRRYPSDTCYAPGCAELRCTYGKHGGRRSIFCARHRSEAERAYQLGRKAVIQEPSPLTAAEVYATWGKPKDNFCDAWFDGVAVWGMREIWGARYVLTLADGEHVTVRGDTALARYGARAGKREAGEEML